VAPEVGALPREAAFGDSDRPVTGHREVCAADAILLEGLAGAVILVAVELDDDLLVEFRPPYPAIGGAWLTGLA
jgi:hypothetical protein